MYKKISINLIFILAIFTGCATNTTFNQDKKRLSSKDLELAQIYYKNEEYKKLLELYEEYAIKGDFFAEYGLGFLYYSGKGVEKDINKAIEWYEKSANKGYSGAEYMLGKIYYFEKKDDKKGVYWLEKASIQGHSQAQANLRYIERKAIEWHREPQNHKDVDSQYNLGIMYLNDEIKDYPQAIKLFEMSANKGNSKSQLKLAEIYYFGKGVKKDCNIALKWLEKSANEGNYYAQFNLASFYNEGDCIKQDFKKAIEWYEKSANQGNPNAYFNIGIAYYKGKGVIQNHQKGLEMFKKSLNQKDKLQQEYIDRLCKELPNVCVDTKLKF